VQLYYVRWVLIVVGYGCFSTKMKDSIAKLECMRQFVLFLVNNSFVSFSSPAVRKYL